jgi:hypothetical protein
VAIEADGAPTHICTQRSIPMASTKADNNRVAWTYVTDRAVSYRVSAKAVYVLDGTDGAKYGGSAAASTVPKLPKGFRMRAVACTSSGKPDKYIQCYTAACDLYASPGTTVVRDINGVDATYTAASRARAEKEPRDTTRQPA